MRGIVVGTHLSFILWVFLGWCGVCAWSWIGGVEVSAAALPLASSLTCIVIAAVASVLWVAGIGEDQAVPAGELGSPPPTEPVLSQPITFP